MHKETPNHCSLLHQSKAYFPTLQTDQVRDKEPKNGLMGQFNKKEETGEKKQ